MLLHVEPGSGWVSAAAEHGAGSGSVPDDLPAGTYRITFDTGGYFAATGRQGFYPEVAVTFTVIDAGEHLVVRVRQILDALDYLRSQLSIAMSTEDILEGVQAFFEKREPKWKGR